MGEHNIKPGQTRGAAGLVDKDNNLNPQIPSKWEESPKPSKLNVSPSKQITLSKQIPLSTENDIPQGGTTLADKLPQALVAQRAPSKAKVSPSKQITPSKQIPSSKQNVIPQEGTSLADKLPQPLVKSPKPSNQNTKPPKKIRHSKPNVSPSKQIKPSNLNVNPQKLVETPHNSKALRTKPTNTDQTKNHPSNTKSLHDRLKKPEKLSRGDIGTQNLATETRLQASPLVPNKHLSKANQIISTNHPLIHSNTKEENSACLLKPPPVVKPSTQECSRKPSSSKAKSNLVAHTAQRIADALQKASNYARNVKTNFADQICSRGTKNSPSTTPPLADYEDPQTSLAKILLTESDLESGSEDELTAYPKASSEYTYSQFSKDSIQNKPPDLTFGNSQPKQYLDSLEHAATQILNLIGKLNNALETDTDSISLTSVQSQLNNLHTKLLDQSNNRKLKSNSRTSTRRDSNVLLSKTTKNVNEVKEEQVIEGALRTVRKKDVSEVLEKVIRKKTNKEDIKTLKFIVRPDGMASSGSASDKATTNISTEHDKTCKPVHRVPPSSLLISPVACSTQNSLHKAISRPHKSANNINNCNSELQEDPTIPSSNTYTANFCNTSQRNQSAQLMGQTYTKSNAGVHFQSNPSNISHAQTVQPVLRNTHTTYQTSHPDCAVCNKSKLQSSAVSDVQQCSLDHSTLLEPSIPRTKHDLSQCYLAGEQSLSIPSAIDFNKVFQPNTNCALTNTNMPIQYCSTPNSTQVPVCVPSFEIVDTVCNSQVAGYTNLDNVTPLDFETKIDLSSGNVEECINMSKQPNLDLSKIEQQHDLNQTQAIFDLILESYQIEPFDLPVVRNFFNMINGLKGKLAWKDLFLCLIDNIEQFSAVKIFDRHTFQEVGHFNLIASEMEEVYACGLIELFQYARNRNLERDPNAHKSITPTVAELIYKDLQRPGGVPLVDPSKRPRDLQNYMDCTFNSQDSIEFSTRLSNQYMDM